jgi:hypothetical protein
MNTVKDVVVWGILPLLALGGSVWGWGRILDTCRERFWWGKRLVPNDRMKMVVFGIVCYLPYASAVDFSILFEENGILNAPILLTFLALASLPVIAVTYCIRALFWRSSWESVAIVGIQGGALAMALGLFLAMWGARAFLEWPELFGSRSTSTSGIAPGLAPIFMLEVIA